MTTAFISHSDCGRHDTGWGHPEHVGRIRAVPKALREDAPVEGEAGYAEGTYAEGDGYAEGEGFADSADTHR